VGDERCAFALTTKGTGACNSRSVSWGLVEAIAYVNSHERPLALYYFGPKGLEREAALSRTTSGGVAVNDVMGHVLHENLPFGGVGPSGMGAYHGRDGFLNFSHKKSVYFRGCALRRLIAL